MTDPCTPITATARDGAGVTACAHGGQVLGWRPAGGEDLLWLSPTTRCGPGRAVRGGVPVIFPQFADRRLPGQPALPKHGVVRDRAWELSTPGPGADEGRARLVARLTDDERSRAVWPQRFTVTVEALAWAARLDVELSVVNDGESDLVFCAALHTYLAVDDAATATITGLEGLRAQDNAAGGAPTSVPSGRLSALGPRDLAILGVDRPVVVEQPGRPPLTLTASGFPDRVLWNPGDAHGLGDVPADGARGFVCVEPAALTPVVVPPAGRWTGTMHLVSGG